jgi:hypothetical protein
MLKKILFIPIFAVLIIALSYNSAYASTQITGTATKCINFNACSYTITGGGVASTNGVLSFKLPGEALTTTATHYSIQYVIVNGIYHITGTFTAIDANTGKLVTGTTDVYEKIYGHSGRGGGNYYSLVSGTITFNITNLDGSSTAVKCNPSSIMQGGTTTCTVTVTDPGVVSNTPTGIVSFTMSSAIGTIDPSCNLSSGSCSVVFRSNAEYDPSTTIIYATYGGDTSHIGSSGSTLLYVTLAPGN